MRGREAQVSDGRPKTHDERQAAKFEAVFGQGPTEGGVPACVGGAPVDMGALRKLLWSGAPSDPQIRALAWSIALGYLPTNRDRQAQVLARKRAEYREVACEQFSAAAQGDLLQQIAKDLPRTIPCPAVQHPRVLKVMERALYVWSVRNPASGYVQGINDLIVPFLVVFLSRELGSLAPELLDTCPDETLEAVEADSYWCLTKVLSQITDHYTFGQPGLFRTVQRLRVLVKRIDEDLYAHLEEQNTDFQQFSFRWMNNLLIREIPLSCAIRLWDTYIAEENGFANFHVYVCAVFLVYWSPQLKKMGFEELLLFLQKVPTADWGNSEVETLLAEAFILKELFERSPSHFA